MEVTISERQRLKELERENLILCRSFDFHIPLILINRQSSTAGKMMPLLDKLREQLRTGPQCANCSPVNFHFNAFQPSGTTPRSDIIP